MKLRLMRGKYYARIRVWDGYKQTDQVIPLKTTPIANKDRNGKITLEPCEKTLFRLKKVEEVLPYSFFLNLFEIFLLLIKKS